MMVDVLFKVPLNEFHPDGNKVKPKIPKKKSKIQFNLIIIKIKKRSKQTQSEAAKACYN